MRPRNALRTIGAAAAAWLMLAGGAARPAAAQTIPVTVGGEASSLAGVAFDVPIIVDMSARPELLGSFVVRLQWSPAVLELVSGRDGGFGHVITVNEDSLAAGVLLMSGANAAGVGGRIILATGRFRPLAEDTTTVRVTVRELYAAGSFADLTSFAAPSNKPYCPAYGRHGDVDADGAANSRDALVALSASVGLDVSGFNVALGDVDGNGRTEARDALIILSYAVGLDVSSFRVFTIAPGACVVGIRPNLTVTPGSVTVSPGQRIVFNATATDSVGNPVAAADVFWASSDDQVVAIGPSGYATALEVGTAVVRAVQSGGDTATATVTVTNQRHVYWVDALAASAQNQLGDPAFPFGTIQEAVYFAGHGDTVRVRPGTYRENVAIDRSVVLEGDTSMGGVRPLLGWAAPWNPALAIGAVDRVEVLNFRTDTLYQTIVAHATDTLLIRNVEFRTPANGYANVISDTVGILRIAQSTFYGPSVWQYGTGAVEVSNAGKVVVDSSVIAYYGGEGLWLEMVDSLVLRGNRIHDNLGWGVYVCNGCYTADTTRGVAAVVRGNRFAGSDYGQVWLGYYRSAAFAHNVWVGGGYYYYDALGLYGHGGAVASIVADSFDVRDGSWIGADWYDSILVDSTVVVQRNDYGYFYNGRSLVVRNSQFRELDYGALDVYTGVPNAVVALRDVAFLGPDSSTCANCATAIWVSNAALAADRVTGTNLYRAFDGYYADIAVDSAQFTGAKYVVDSYCSSTRLSNVTAVGGYAAVYASGCAADDSLTVDASRFQRFWYGMQLYYTPTRVEGSSFLDVAYPLYHNCRNATFRNDTLSNGYYGVQAYGCWGGTGYADSLLVDSLWAEQFTSYGVYGYGWGSAEVARSVFTQMPDAVYLTDGRIRVTDNTMGGITSDGIRVDSDTYGSVSVERNQVTCTGGAEGIMAWSYLPDTTTVRDNVVSGCLSGAYAYGDWTFVRGNAITMPGTRLGANGIEAQGDSVLRVVGNTVSGVARYGSIDVSYSRGAHVDSNTVAGSAEAGLYVYYVDSLLARANTFTAHDTAGCCLSEPAGAIVLSGTYTGRPAAALLRGNRITGSASNGVVLYRNSSLDTVTVVVDSNSVKGAKASGIHVAYYSRASLTRNAIDSSGTDGVYLDRSATDSTAVALRNNNFTRSGRYGVYNADGASARYDATNNWWNDVNGPSGFYGNAAGGSIGDSVSANLRWNPWLTATQSDAPVPAPPALLASVLVEPAVILPLRSPGALPDGTRRPEPQRAGVAGDPPARLPRFVPPDGGSGLIILPARADATAMLADRLAARREHEAAVAERRAAEAQERLRREDEARAQREAGRQGEGRQP